MTIRHALLALTAVALGGPSTALGAPSPIPYCQPTAPSLFDPIDRPAGGSGPVVRPGIRERTITVAGRATRLLESGRRSGRTAVVLVHGIPGSAADWADLLPRLGDRKTRAVALDLPGFGHAQAAWGRDRSPEVAATFLKRALDQLRITRVHLVAHDIGGPIALEWAARHPDRLRSATVINTGLLFGYKEHPIALVSRPPVVGEAFWLALKRVVFKAGLTARQTRPVPGATLDRWYDDLDRETRCTFLETYRTGGEADVDARARRQADVLRRWPTRPALVIWGAEDPFLPVAMADAQRQGFPAARIEVFQASGHWPFIDDVPRTDALVVPFVHDAIARDHRRRFAGRPWTLRRWPEHGRPPRTGR